MNFMLQQTDFVSDNSTYIQRTGNKHIIDRLEQLDRERSKNAENDCVCDIERTLLQHLRPAYLRKLIVDFNWAPQRGSVGCIDTWFGIELVWCRMLDDLSGGLIFSFRMDKELTDALWLPKDSELQIRVSDRLHETQDAYESQWLRISKRQRLTYHRTLEQIQAMKARVEMLLPLLLLKNG